MADPVREAARAKLNLRLRVLGRADPELPAVETVVLRLDLADEVELRPGAGGLELEVEAERRDSGRPRNRPAGGAGEGSPPSRADDVPDGPGNLCWRAARRFYGEAAEEPDVAVRLLKRVPVGGGLGGGGADAAAVLRGLSRLHGDPLPPSALLRLAAELDAAGPFSLLDRPMALGWGRGDRLMPLDPPPPRPMVLLVPETPVSAADACRWLNEDRRPAGEADDDACSGSGGEARGSGDGEEREGRDGSDDRAGAPERTESDAPRNSRPEAARAPSAVLPRAPDLSRWDALLPVRGNDFEGPVFARRPELAWWKEELLGEGAEAALLCGTGSTVCGIFTEARRRDAAAERLRESGEVAVLTTRGPV